MSRRCLSYNEGVSRIWHGGIKQRNAADETSEPPCNPRIVRESARQYLLHKLLEGLLDADLGLGTGLNEDHAARARECSTFFVRHLAISLFVQCASAV